jgi:hypothetical protein
MEVFPHFDAKIYRVLRFDKPSYVWYKGLLGLWGYKVWKV